MIKKIFEILTYFALVIGGSILCLIALVPVFIIFVFVVILTIPFLILSLPYAILKAINESKNEKR